MSRHPDIGLAARLRPWGLELAATAGGALVFALVELWAVRALAMLAASSSS